MRKLFIAGALVFWCMAGSAAADDDLNMDIYNRGRIYEPDFPEVHAPIAPKPYDGESGLVDGPRSSEERADFIVYSQDANGEYVAHPYWRPKD